MKKVLTLILMTIVMTFTANAEWTVKGTEVSQKNIKAKVIDRRGTSANKSNMGLIKYTNNNPGKYALVEWKVYSDGVLVDAGESCIRPNGAEDTFDYGENLKEFRNKRPGKYTITIQVTGISDNPIRPKGIGKRSQFKTGTDLPVIRN